MRRWFFVFLLTVMPVQLVWASMAPYCAHETSSAAKKHFGHHEHQHQADGAAATEPDDQGLGSGTHHADCASCHLGCALVLAATTPFIGVLPHADIPGVLPASYTSHVPCGPERPDRVELPAAARFGGGVEFVC